MKLSEFWAAVDAVHGPVLGRSHATDLHLPHLGATAVEALQRGDDPRLVWQEYVRETDADESALWIHRVDPKDRRRPRH
ncbi:DUF3046 domain-containing protein [Schaalia sp. 19OD2882]|uniref:DUF3046 domain-containing protein n=1 Tax=Schaalia sp. 19OD2882 TaxID=2794089 RepID=UPI001C1EB5F3|nr:DUF3046 domain-containing protein [Schaalia sp. 19OD2882]QWW18962.1 DUF3046 domain-containing protein [Schaalia sp. 19OD2882]